MLESVLHLGQKSLFVCLAYLRDVSQMGAYSSHILVLPHAKKFWFSHACSHDFKDRHVTEVDESSDS